MNLPRLDLLIYAHDGRGLGHASRSIAVGMAVRRLFPEMKVLFVSGCKLSASFIGKAPLDWLKLPSYETRVVQGKSRGTKGYSNFSDADLGRFRSRMIRDIVVLYRPRCVLADHSPQGKHKELLPGIEGCRGSDTRWVLGVRGVVGEVPQVFSELAESTFRSHYHSMLWYGDSGVLGIDPKNMLHDRFGKPPVETGYVSRLSEWVHWQAVPPPADPFLAGTVSIPWAGEHTYRFLSNLADALGKIGSAFGNWRLFIGLPETTSKAGSIYDLFHDMPFCSVEPAGAHYPEAVINSKIAVIYGGYNSITDVLWANKPAVVVLRSMQDREQETHVAQLRQASRSGMSLLDEGTATVDDLFRALKGALSESATTSHRIDVNGAERAAGYLSSLIEEPD